MLLIDAGQICREDVDKRRGPAPACSKRCNATWLEEPFLGGAYDAYARTRRAQRQGHASPAARPRTISTWRGN